MTDRVAEPEQTSHSDIESRFDPAALKHRVRAGAGATAAAQIFGQAIQIATVAVLYRLLTPSQFGLFWMVVSVLLVLRIFCTLGLNVGTIQQASLTSEQLSAVFWLTILFGSLTTLATAALAPAVAAFYRQPELVRLTLVMSGTSFMIAAAAQHQALLERSLRLPELVTLRIVAKLSAGGAAIAAALAGAGVWALAIQWYAEIGLLLAGVWWLEPWRPSLRFNAGAARGMMRFGGYLSAAELTFALAQNLDKMLVGRWLGPVAEGFYGQAYSWMMKPVDLVVPPVASLLLPALARAAYDKTLYSQVWFSFSRLVGMVMIPAGVGVAIVSPEALLVLGGERWVEAGYLLRVMAIAIVVKGFMNLAGSVLASVGRTDRLFGASILMVIVLAVAYVLGFLVGNWFDQPTLGVAAAHTIATLVLFVPYMVFCLSAAQVSVREWLRVLAPLVLPAVVMGVVVIAVRMALVAAGARPLVLLGIEIAVGMGAFFLLAHQQVRWLLGQLRTMLAGQPAGAVVTERPSHDDPF